MMTLEINDKEIKGYKKYLIGVPFTILSLSLATIIVLSVFSIPILFLNGIIRLF